MRAHAPRLAVPKARRRSLAYKACGLAGLALILVLQLVWIVPDLPTLRLSHRQPANARQAGAEETHGAVGQRAAAAAAGMPSPAIVVFCYNRPDYLRLTLGSLLNLTGIERYAVIVSQACGGRQPSSPPGTARVPLAEAAGACSRPAGSADACACDPRRTETMPVCARRWVRRWRLPRAGHGASRTGSGRGLRSWGASRWGKQVGQCSTA